MGLKTACQSNSNSLSIFLLLFFCWSRYTNFSQGRPFCLAIILNFIANCCLFSVSNQSKGSLLITYCKGTWAIWEQASPGYHLLCYSYKKLGSYDLQIMTKKKKKSFFPQIVAIRFVLSLASDGRRLAEGCWFHFSWTISVLQCTFMTFGHMPCNCCNCRSFYCIFF